MTRSQAIVFLLALWLSAALTHAQEKPNFLFIMADDCTYWDIGCYGGQAKTPHIDALAKESMRFTQCFQSAPMCSPTRHNIYTGLYPVKSGAYPNHTRANPGTKSVVQYLKPLGYRVALSGKKHIAPRDIFAFEYSGGNNPDMKAIDRLMAKSAAKKTPFALFACSNEPHDPWNLGDPSQYDADKLKLPPNWVDTPETRKSMTRYLAEITYYDGQVGELLALLDKHKLKDNTMVVVLSEQGSIYPFAKWTCYDAGLQSAMLIRWPGKIAPGSVTDALVEYIDILPTFIDAAGGTPAPVLQGKSMIELITGKTTSHKEYVFGEMTTRGIINGSPHYGIRSIRSAQYKLIWNFTPETPFRNIFMRKPVWKSWLREANTNEHAAKLVNRFRNRPEWELYDVSKDTFEQTNLADKPEFAAVQEDLTKRLKTWMAECGDQGQATELAASEHQAGKKKKPKKK